jgi:hypothetical protein
MRRGVIRRIIDQRVSQRPRLLDTIFAQCGERRVDRLGAPPLVVRRLWVHVRLPPAFSRSSGLPQQRLPRFRGSAIRGGVGSVKPSLQ